MAAAHEVPGKYDLVISDGTDSLGLVLYDAYRSDANAPEKAVHSFSPIFVPRTNIEGNYGDDKQEFFLTFSQKDWSLGEQQKYARASDSITRRYWVGENVDITTPGQVSLRRQSASVAVGATVSAAIGRGAGTVMMANTTNLFTIDAQGTVTDHGAHGLAGEIGSPHGIAVDGANTYVSDDATALVRKWDGSAFSTFSTSPADALLFHNNALYGFSAGSLYRWATNGTRTTLHTFQDADGDANTYAESDAFLLAYGGKILIHLTQSGGIFGQVHVYDGVGVSKLFDVPENFISRSACISNGVLYVGGAFRRNTGASTQYRAAVMYYANGSIGVLWKSDNWFTFASDLGTANVTPLDGGLVITDDSTEKFLFYDPAVGGVHTIGSYTTSGTGTNQKLVSCSPFCLRMDSSSTVTMFPHSSSFATSGTITSSLIDFDSSLDKLFRGIKIDYDEASDGDGGSVDIAYRLNDLASTTYTALQTGAVSGTEYTLGTAGSPIKGRSISVKLTLNKGTSTLGPVLKRLYVRAAPIVNSTHRSVAVVNLTGRNGDSPVPLRDGSLSPLDGLEMAHMLKDFVQSETLLSITDKFGTRVSVIEQCEFIEVRPEEFIAQVVFREV